MQKNILWTKNFTIITPDTFISVIGGGAVVVGALGEIFPYRYVTFSFAAFTFLCILFFIVKNRSSVQGIYNRKLR